MNTPRLILVAVVLVFTLYAVGVAMTRRNQNGKASTENGLSAWLGSFSGAGAGVSAADLTLANCVFASTVNDRIMVPGGAPSSIKIDKITGKNRVRMLKLSLRNGAPKPIQITYKPEPASAGSNDGEVRLSKDDQRLFDQNSATLECTVPVGPEGGTIIVLHDAARGPLEILLK